MLITIKLYACYTAKIYSFNKPNKFKGGGMHPVRRSDPPINWETLFRGMIRKKYLSPNI